MLDALRPPFTLERREVFVAASVGIALRMPSAPELSSDELVREADIALYRAKAAGKARAVLFDPTMNARILERLELEGDLRRALERGELRLDYQPIVDLETGRVAEVEALLHWEHPERGLIAPLEFIPIAEEVGLIVPIGRWVLREACRQAQAWQARYPSERPLLMSVNVSAREFQQPDLIGQVAAVLDETGLAPACLRLEITESVLMDDAPATEATLRGMRALGVRLAIDDFGTGYSSLGYLQRFSVDTLKIDRAFVTPLDHDEQAGTIVRAVTALGHALGIEVTAEGIETAGHWARLRALGCDYEQGYYFARPVPSETMSRLLVTGLHGGLRASNAGAA
jgi:EAL domain-containing protein (putative c-di-GMP-specific phosphodiesterase class I)